MNVGSVWVRVLLIVLLPPAGALILSFAAVGLLRKHAERMAESDEFWESFGSKGVYK